MVFTYLGYNYLNFILEPFFVDYNYSPNYGFTVIFQKTSSLKHILHISSNLMILAPLTIIFEIINTIPQKNNLLEFYEFREFSLVKIRVNLTFFINTIIKIVRM